MTEVEPAKQRFPFSGSLVWQRGTCGAYRRCKRTGEMLEGNFRTRSLRKQRPVSGGWKVVLRGLSLLYVTCSVWPWKGRWFSGKRGKTTRRRSLPPFPEPYPCPIAFSSSALWNPSSRNLATPPSLGHFSTSPREFFFHALLLFCFALLPGLKGFSHLTLQGLLGLLCTDSPAPAPFL